MSMWADDHGEEHHPICSCGQGWPCSVVLAEHARLGEEVLALTGTDPYSFDHGWGLRSLAVKQAAVQALRETRDQSGRQEGE